MNIEQQLMAKIHSMQGQPCILCDRPADMAAFFVPYDSEDWGATLGKTRIIGYPICSACRKLPQCSELAEAAMAAKLGLKRAN